MWSAIQASSSPPRSGRGRLTLGVRAWYPMPVSVPREAQNSVDARLVAALAQGDKRALGSLYETYGTTLLTLANRMLRSAREAEDLVHDVFLEAWRHAGEYDPGRGSVRAWLVTRTRSRCLDRLKSPGMSRVVAMDLEAERHDLAAPTVDPTSGSDGAIVRRALAALPADQRTVLELAYFEGLALSEVAEKLGVPLGTIKSRLARALARLRDDLHVLAEGEG